MFDGIPQKFQTFLSRLTRVTASPKGNKWYACCPAHDDHDPSLTVSIGTKGNLVVCCNAPSSCRAEAICKAVGLTLSDLFLENKPTYNGAGAKFFRSPTVVYQYRYADGTLAYETLRYDNPKDFRQRRPNPAHRLGSGQPRYFHDLEGVQLIPYRLPELIASGKAHPDHWLNLVEGEKCAETMAVLKCNVTTHALGSGNWREEYAPYFRGRKVAIWYDLDPYHPKTRIRSGQAWAIQAARSILPYAAEVRVCRPPDVADDSKEDIADFIRLVNKGYATHEAIRQKLFNVIMSVTPYYPGWETGSEFVAMMMNKLKSIDHIPSSMNEAMTDVMRKLDAAVNGVKLNSITNDLASAAAWCMWLATTLSPKLGNPVINLGPTQNSEPKPEGEPGEAKRTAETQHTNETMCVQPQAVLVEEAEPEPC